MEGRLTLESKGWKKERKKQRREGSVQEMVQWLKNLPPKPKGRSLDPSTGVNDRWSRWPALGRQRWGILGTNCLETRCW